MAYTIYLRTNTINGLMYVGQTKNWKRRENKWKCLKSKYSNKYLEEERLKYGLDAFESKILSECDTEEEANELEQRYIKEYNTKYPNGYNMSDGGAGPNNCYIPDELREKLREVNKGEKNGFYGKTHTKEVRKRIREANLGRRNSGTSKAVEQIDKVTNEVLNTFPSALEASRQTGIEHSNICGCCRGVTKTAGGFKWRYVKQDEAQK